MSEAPDAEDTAGSRPESPYLGLVPYDEGDASYFFGRSTEVAIVAANLRSTRLTILYGPSGVGKSSLLMAGAVHSLREEARAAASTPERPFGICVYRSWRDDPAQGVQEAARVALQESAGAEPLPPPAATLAETLRVWTAQTGTLLVVFDQFEEYFQYQPNEGNEERLTGFADELAAIVNDPTLPVNVLLSLREDAWPKLDHFEGHVPALFANYLRVDHLDLDAAREAIEGPIAVWNRSRSGGEEPYEIEPALVEAVLVATAGGGLPLSGERDSSAVETTGDRIEAPFLQLVLDRLWRDTTAAGERRLTRARLEALGGAARIVENHLQHALSRLTTAEQNAASDCFRFLVSKSKTKIAHTVSDLAEWTQQPETEVTAVLDKLCTGEGGRILRVNAPAQEGGSASYELFHDILAEPILAWRRDHEVERSRRAARRRVARIGGVLLSLVAVFAGLGIWALVQQHAAKRAEASATSLFLAGSAEKQLSGSLDASLLLSLEAYRKSRTPQSTSSMLSALEAARRSGAEAILRTHQGSVSDVAFSRGGETLATAGQDGTVLLWDARTHKKLGPPLRGQSPVSGVAFSPDGHTLASADDDGTFLWDVRTHSRRRDQPLKSHQGRISGVAFSPDGRMLASADYKGTVRVWDVTTPNRSPISLQARQVHVLGVTFSPDGRTLASAGQDGTTRLWDIRTSTQVGRPVNGRQGPVDAVAFSPDGQKLATAGSDGTVMLWDVRPPHTLLATLDGHQSDLTGVAFRDGHTLATAGREGTVLLWDTRTPKKPVATLSGKQRIVRGIAFSPNGNTLASAGSDGTVRLWDTRRPKSGGQPSNGFPGEFYGIAFSPNGRMLATAGDDGAVRLWDTSTRTQLGQLPSSNQGAAFAVAFSPDGRTLATAGEDGKVWLWDASTRDPLAGNPFDATSGGPVHGVAFSQDGQTLATAGGDGKVRLWDATTRDPLAGNPLNATKNEPVYGVAFSPNGQTLASAGQDGKVLFWDTATHVELGRLNVSEGPVYGVAFSRDGGAVATAGGDGKVRLWDTSTRTPLGQPLDTDQDGAYAVAFSPDGHTLGATGYGGPALLWEGILWRDFADLKVLVCDLVVGNLTRAEWDALAPGLAYSTTCPS